VSNLFGTLATKEDQVWPYEKWPRMKFEDGLQKGAKGGHGPIRYSVDKYEPNELIQFKFSKPKGFNGIHRFEISGIENTKTELKHTIEMTTSGIGTLTWIIAIRWLHDALVEDAFDKVEKYFTREKKSTEWNLWVKILRIILNPRKKAHNNS